MAGLVAQGENKFTLLKNINQSIFRAYDIRGVVEEELTPDTVFTIGIAFGNSAYQKNQKTVIVGRDGRLSSPELFDALSSGLMVSGCDVIDIGIVPTPLLYFATHRLSTQTGIMITGSHNPVQYNGLKMVLDGVTLSTEGVQTLYHSIANQELKKEKNPGEISRADVMPDYLDYICHDIKLSKPLHVIIDAGNGVGALVAPQLYRRLGCHVDELYCEIDGTFPNHHPDPTVPKNLKTLQEKVKEKGADIGLAFDGDADRLGVITNNGKIIWPDKQLMLFAKHLLPKYPGAPFVFDVKCSFNLPHIIKEYGGKPVMYRTGHSVLKKKMIELNSPLSGELSGHIFFKDRWFGFDDGIYVGARLLEILSSEEKSIDELIAELPKTVNTPELKIHIEEDKKTGFMESLKKALAGTSEKGVEIITIDGVRVEFKYGWGLVRPSNTTPCLTLRFEADSEENLNKIKEFFRQILLKLDQTLQLPF